MDTDGKMAHAWRLSKACQESMGDVTCERCDCTQAAPQLRAPRKMFSQAALKKVMEAGSEQELQAIFQELQAQDRTIEQHINLIDQMEDDTLGETASSTLCISVSFGHSRRCLNPKQSPEGSRLRCWGETEHRFWLWVHKPKTLVC